MFFKIMTWNHSDEFVHNTDQVLLLGPFYTYRYASLKFAGAGRGLVLP